MSLLKWVVFYLLLVNKNRSLKLWEISINTLDAKWHWYRYEYLARGSIHCYGTAKLSNDPGLCDLTKPALKGYIARKFKDENDSGDNTELEHVVEAGEKAAETACQYVDWLLSSINPVPPDDVWIQPPVHPCQKHHEDTHDHEVDDDFIDLLNSVQRHTRCSTHYCLKETQRIRVEMQVSLSFWKIFKVYIGIWKNSFCISSWTLQSKDYYWKKLFQTK